MRSFWILGPWKLISSNKIFNLPWTLEWIFTLYSVIFEREQNILNFDTLIIGLNLVTPIIREKLQIRLREQKVFMQARKFFQNFWIEYELLK